MHWGKILNSISMFQYIYFVGFFLLYLFIPMQCIGLFPTWWGKCGLKVNAAEYKITMFHKVIILCACKEFHPRWHEISSRNSLSSPSTTTSRHCIIHTTPLQRIIFCLSLVMCETRESPYHLVKFDTFLPLFVRTLPNETYWPPKISFVILFTFPS